MLKKIFDNKKKRDLNLAFLTYLYFKNRIYSTVTDFAKLRGWSTLQPLITAM